MTIIRRDQNNRVVEILERSKDDNGKQIFHPDLMRDIFDVPNAQVGWLFDELLMRCAPPPDTPIDPELERLLRMEFIEKEFVRAMLVNDVPLQNDLRREYTQLTAQSSAVK